LRTHGVQLIDCQQETSHLASLGAAPISRERFLEHLRHAIGEPAITDWTPVSPMPAPPAREGAMQGATQHSTPDATRDGAAAKDSLE
jgi:leucyl/phenylalanyl-tRNA--protein transferase